MGSSLVARLLVGGGPAVEEREPRGGTLVMVLLGLEMAGRGSGLGVEEMTELRGLAGSVGEGAGEEECGVSLVGVTRQTPLTTVFRGMLAGWKRVFLVGDPAEVEEEEVESEECCFEMIVRRRETLEMTWGSAAAAAAGGGGLAGGLQLSDIRIGMCPGIIKLSVLISPLAMLLLSSSLVILFLFALVIFPDFNLR
jgi:hypothetical protein